MTPNPYLKKLGFSETDRVVIVHTDDIGMCQASLTAFEHLWEFGTISSGAVMVLCPWFPAVARFCREHPGWIWASMPRSTPNGRPTAGGRFRPATPARACWTATATSTSGSPPCTNRLTPPLSPPKWKPGHGTRPLRIGIDVTHLDSHMGTVLHPRFIQSYLHGSARARNPHASPPGCQRGLEDRRERGRKSRLRPRAGLSRRKTSPCWMACAECRSTPLWRPSPDCQTPARASRPVGISHFILHPPVDTPELRAIAPDWQARVANYQAFMSPELKAFHPQRGHSPDRLPRPARSHAAEQRSALTGKGSRP